MLFLRRELRYWSIDALTSIALEIGTKSIEANSKTLIERL